MSRDALVVGINIYRYGSLSNLKSVPAEDAEAIAQLLETYGGFRVRRLPGYTDTWDNHARRVAHNTEVTVKDLRTAIEQLFYPGGHHIPETALLYFSGHGLRQPWGKRQKSYLATSDADPDQEQWGFDLTWLQEILQDSPIKQQVVWLDCCHSGELLNSSGILDSLTTNESSTVNESLQDIDPGSEEDYDRCLITASRGFELAFQQINSNHSVLTAALLKGLDPTQRLDEWVTNVTLTEFITKSLAQEVQCPLFLNYGKPIVLTTAVAQKAGDKAEAEICPYKGLEYFDLADAEFFYGRTTLTDRLINKISHGNFLAVIGPSGSGKSSVVRAGLLHQLKIGRKLAGSDRWQYNYKSFTPGEHPLQSLEQVVGVRFANLANTIQVDIHQRVVLFIDQFEECFTLCQNHTVRQQFFDCLLDILQQTAGKLLLIIAMRADFLGKCAEYPQLADKMRIQGSVELVVPMSQEELREVVIEPARKVGLEVEPLLVSRIIEDVQNSPGSLPLLEFTLKELWKVRKVPYLKALTLFSYEQLEGIKGALTKVANAVYGDLSLEEQTIAKRIFLELIQLGEGTEDTRRRIVKQDLITSQQSEILIDEVIQRLVDERLIVTDEIVVDDAEQHRSIIVDVAHEALIRNWSTLRVWLEENRRRLRLIREIEQDARKWRQNDKKEDFLRRGLALDQAEEWFNDYADEVSVNIREFIAACLDLRERERLESERREQERLKNQILTDANQVLTEANQKASEANQKANRKIRIGTVFLAASLTGAAIASSFTVFNLNRLDEAQQTTKLEQASVSVRQQFQTGQLPALVSAIHLVSDLKKLVKNEDEFQDYPTISPLAALQNILNHIYERNAFDSQQDEVKRVSFTLNGEQIVSAGSNGTIKIWTLSGQLVREWNSNQNEINHLSISPQEERVATAGADGTVKLWSLSGHLLMQWIAHPIGGVNYLSFSPEGEKVVTAGGDGRIRVWNLLGRRLAEWKAVDGEHDGVRSLAVSPDGERIISTGDDRAVKLWSLSGQAIAKFNMASGQQVLSVNFSPNGQEIAIAGENGIAELWNISGKPIAEMKGHQGRITSISFSSNEQFLVTTGGDRTVRIWNLAGQEIAQLTGHQGVVWSASFSKDNKYLVTGGYDGTIRLWDLSDKPVIRLQADGIDIESISFSPDSQKIATVGYDGMIRLWKLDGKLKAQTQRPGRLWDVSFSPDGQHVAAVGDYNTIRIWDLSTQAVNLLQTHGISITSVNFSPDGQQIATGEADGTVSFWALSGEQVGEVKGHQGPVWDIDFSRDGQMIATAGADGTVLLWDKAGQEKLKLSARREQIRSIDFSPNDQQIAVGGDDGQLRVWNVSGKLEMELDTNHGRISGVKFSPDGQTIATAGLDGTIRIWDLNGHQVFEFTGNASPVRSLSFSPDGKYIVAGAGKDGVYVWKIETLSELLKRSCNWLEYYLGSHPDLSKMCTIAHY